MCRVTGRFYYRLTNNGNLAGEFSNNGSRHPQPELAERMIPDNALPSSPFSFLGIYRSCWFEEAGDGPVWARLEITQKLDHYQIYTLLWTPLQGTTRFDGEAMIGEGLLIGNYWMP